MKYLKRKFIFCLNVLVTITLTIVFLVPVVLVTLGECCKSFCETIADYLNRMLWDVFISTK